MTRSFVLFCVALIGLTACSALPEGEAKYPTGADRGATGNDVYKKPEGIFGPGGLFGRNKSSDEGASIGVNSYLWRGSLDTISFMPLASADPFGGTIITDWYTPPETPDERFKLNIYILSKQLKSDGVNVKVFRQVRGKGGWKDVASDTSVARQLEDSILTRARQMRVADLQAE